MRATSAGALSGSQEVSEVSVTKALKRLKRRVAYMPNGQEDHGTKKFSKFSMQLDSEGRGYDVVGSGRRVSEIKHKVLCNQQQKVEVQCFLISAFL